MSFRKTSLDEISRIHTAASNIKKTLQDRVINEKLGEADTASALEKQYKPLAGILGLQTDQQAGPNDLVGAEGKKIMRLSELLNNVLQNINVTNQALSTKNPAYVDSATTPGVPPNINISELTVNTLARIGQVKNNLDVLVGDTSQINKNLAELNMVIAEGKLDVDNVEAKLNEAYKDLNGIEINDITIQSFIAAFEKEAKSITSGLALNPSETSFVLNAFKQFLESQRGVDFDTRQIPDMINRFKIDDRRTLQLLSRVDKNIQDLAVQNKDLGDKLSEIPEGLAGVIQYLPDAISRAISVQQMSPDEKKKAVLTREELIANTPLMLQKDVIDLWERTPIKPHTVYDLQKHTGRIGKTDSPNPFFRIGKETSTGVNGSYIRADLLVGDNPRLEIYDGFGDPDLNTVGGVEISRGLRDLLIYTQDEIRKLGHTLTIPSDELELIRPYFQRVKGTVSAAKLRFLTGDTNIYTFSNKTLAESVKPRGLNLKYPPGATLKSMVTAAVPSTTRAPSPTRTPTSPVSSAQIQQQILQSGVVSPSAIARTKSIGKTAQQPPTGMGFNSTRFGLMSPDGIFGNVWINPQRLGYGMLHVHKQRPNTPLGKTAIKYGLGLNIAEKPTLRANIDGDLINLLTKRYNKKYQYSPLSIDLFKQISGLAGYNDLTAHGKGTKRNLLTKGAHAASDPSGKIVKIITDPNELIERMALLVGSIEAGNMSPVLRSELGEIADILLNKQMIDRAAHKTIFERYILNAI